MNVIETPLKGVLLIEPRVFGDSRGFFFESFHAARYAEKGIAGILSFVLVIGVVFAGLRRAKQQLKMVERLDLIPWITALQLGLVSYLLTSLFLHDDYNRYLWLLIAFAVACTVMTEALVRQHHEQIEEFYDDLSSAYTLDVIQAEPV